MGHISIARAKAEFAALVTRAESGEQIVVTRNGKPVACLGPLPATRPFPFGDKRGLYISDDLSLPEDLIDLMENPRFEDFQ